MTYKNIILIPEGIIFNEKITERAALKNTFKNFNIDNFDEKKELFNQLFERYLNEKRTQRHQLLLTALLPEIELDQSKSEFYQQLIHQTRLTKNIQEDLSQLTEATNLVITSFLPNEIIASRLNNSKLTLKLPTASLAGDSSFRQIITSNNWDSKETLIIGTNLNEEIQQANDEAVDSMWINTGRKVPITPHPTLHVKKFADCLFYLN
ncbi:hypothetical protein [Lactobacillus sp. PV034]|uniref:hypothetical protein n=1 Tax=Lactobacillus sp. PV034 TaxID=2594495 RepID=UPI00223E8EE1|nr:hypothetical protein [Lactobacillus sp. PV034]QNQ81389.1 hypothetical protein FP432_07380 [Lactobacillus sp. PV034]